MQIFWCKPVSSVKVLTELVTFFMQSRTRSTQYLLVEFSLWVMCSARVHRQADSKHSTRCDCIYSLSSPPTLQYHPNEPLVCRAACKLMRLHTEPLAPNSRSLSVSATHHKVKRKVACAPPRTNGAQT